MGIVPEVLEDRTRGRTRRSSVPSVDTLLQGRLDEALKRIRRLEEQVTAKEDTEKRLLARIDELERAGKRQASPFSKGDPKAKPKAPGRKPGEEYGTRRFRARPERVDEEIDVPLPESCPKCEGEVVEVRVAEQFQTDLPPPPPLVVRRFSIHVGKCNDCGCRVQPRHALQTSYALGAAAVQLGPRALALGTQLNKAYGLSWGKVSRLVAETFGLQAARATYCRASLRMAKNLEPTYETLIQATRESPIVTPDETGWRAGGHRRWLWTFVGVTTTVYTIAASRGGDVVRAILGADYAGRLVRDGWAAYRCLTCATHQTCLGHLLHRCHEILEVAKQGQAKFPHAIRRVLKRALDLRERRDELTSHGFASIRGRIEAELDWLLTWRPTYEPNRTFRAHLERERPCLFTFLYDPTVHATNWEAEQALRGLAVMARKLSGGSRTDRGAKAHAIHLSVARTADQQGRTHLPLLMSALLSPEPIVLPLTG